MIIVMREVQTILKYAGRQAETPLGASRKRLSASSLLGVFAVSGGYNDYDRNYYLKNKDKCSAYAKIYYQKNRSKILAHVKKYQLEKGILNGRGTGNYIRTEEHKRRIAATEKGRIIPIEVRKKISATHRAIAHLHPNWKGGISPLNKVIRRSMEYKFWREAVFARDNWTCQNCGKRGYELHPHHIKSFAMFPELRFTIDNGQTLCVNCHRKTDTWGGKKQNVKYFMGANNGLR